MFENFNIENSFPYLVCAPEADRLFYYQPKLSVQCWKTAKNNQSER